MNKALTDVLERVQSWPQDAQVELERVALEIEAELSQSAYHATTEELTGIQLGLEAAERGQFATDEEVKAVVAKYSSP